MRLSAQEIYDRLLNVDHILELEGQIKFFLGDVNIIVYIYLICIFVLIIRRKYHYYIMFGLSVFVVKV